MNASNITEKSGAPTDSSEESSSSTSTLTDSEEAFLRACRHGDMASVVEMLKLKDSERMDFSVSCTGKSKSNFGWTPLHLASYFGHRDVMEVLLHRNANVNAVNDNGDTPLHKATFIGREDIVMLLLQNNADVNIINGEGRLPRNMTPASEVGKEITKLLRAAEATEALRTEGKLLRAARQGNLEMLNQMVSRIPNVVFRNHMQYQITTDVLICIQTSS